MDVVIASQDSDFFQLITERVSVLRYRGKNTVICDPAYIREKLGIEPYQYAAFKSLTGDTADNIRGADKIGPKTAAELMGQAVVEVIDVEKVDGGRQVHYAIEVEGMRKERKAVVEKNEEGAWKVTAITDAN